MIKAILDWLFYWILGIKDPVKEANKQIIKDMTEDEKLSYVEALNKQTEELTK